MRRTSWPAKATETEVPLTPPPPRVRVTSFGALPRISSDSPISEERALEIARSVYGDTAFTRRLDCETVCVGWFTAAKQFEYHTGWGWREALENAGLVDR